MIDDDLDEDGFLFDDIDETDAAFEAQNCLVVAPVCPQQLLQKLEEQQRRDGLPCPVVFVEDGDDGQPYIGNAAAVAAAMGLSPGEIPTETQADAFIVSRKWPSLTW
jgi:hypothetical protein